MFVLWLLLFLSWRSRIFQILVTWKKASTTTADQGQTDVRITIWSGSTQWGGWRLFWRLSVIGIISVMFVNFVLWLLFLGWKKIFQILVTWKKASTITADPGQTDVRITIWSGSTQWGGRLFWRLSVIIQWFIMPFYERLWASFQIQKLLLFSQYYVF